MTKGKSCAQASSSHFPHANNVSGMAFAGDSAADESTSAVCAKQRAQAGNVSSFPCRASCARWRWQASRKATCGKACHWPTNSSASPCSGNAGRSVDHSRAAIMMSLITERALAPSNTGASTIRPGCIHDRGSNIMASSNAVVFTRACPSGGGNFTLAPVPHAGRQRQQQRQNAGEG